MTASVRSTAVPPQEAQPLGDVGAHRGPLRRARPGTARARAAARPTATAQSAAGRGERDARARGDQDAAERRADELVRGQLGGEQAPVGPRQPVARRRPAAGSTGPRCRRSSRRRRCRRRRRRAAQIEPVVGDDRHGEDGRAARPDDVRAEHHPAPVEPVGECAGRQREQQPRQRQREGQPRDQRGGVRVADGDQRQRDLEDAVGEVRQARPTSTAASRRRPAARRSASRPAD